MMERQGAFEDRDAWSAQGWCRMERALELIGTRSAMVLLREESFSDGCESSVTPCRGVFRTALPQVDPIWLDSWISELADLVGRASDEEVSAALAAPHELQGDELAASAAGAR